MKRHRVLIVDDSATMRALIANVLDSAPDIEVVGEVSDPFEAREAIKALDPDVLTLDVEMPRMDGLSFLEKLMRLRPMPVIMVSNHTAASTDLAMQAMAIGALDCVVKPGPHDPRSFDQLVGKVREAAGTSLKGSLPARIVQSPEPATNRYLHDGRVLALGSSAGGIEALSCVLDRFPADGPPVVITQHMPAGFTKGLAARLDRLCDATVREAEDGAPLLPGMIYLAPGGERHLEIAGSKAPYCSLKAGDPVSGHRPSVDVLFRSVARTVGSKAIGVILSGMGRDGSDGLLDMRRSGALTLGQDRATSFIYGMPRAAYDGGAVERQLPLGKIQAAILAATTFEKGRNPCR